MRVQLVLVSVMAAGLIAGPAVSQTLYNSPTQQGTSERAPLNLRELLRRPNTAQQQQGTTATPYLVAPLKPSMAFEQRRAALNQWRVARDSQALASQVSSTQYFKMSEEQSKAAIFGFERGAQSNAVAPPVVQQPSVPMVYEKPDDGNKKPRRLFNTLD